MTQAFRPSLVVEQAAGLAIPETWPKHPLPERAEFASGDAGDVKTATLRNFDEAAEHFSKGRWREGMLLVDHSCKAARHALADEFWRPFAQLDCVGHAVRNFLHQDPFTRRSFQKPRGHAGDAVLVDYMYGMTAHPEHELEEASPLGRWIYAYTTNTHAPRAVRRRMHLIAEMIDRLSIEKGPARVLSVAAGHARELLFSHALAAGGLAEVVLFDQDPMALAEAGRAIASKALTQMQGSILRLMMGRYDLSGFDLVYTAGLFDYVDARAGKKLTRAMFDMLKPGGLLLIGNFLAGIEDEGYMQSFMGWNLVLRNRVEIVGLADGIGTGVAAMRYFEESESNIGFLLVRKAE